MLREKKKNTTKILRIIDGLHNKSFEDIWYLVKQLKIKHKNQDFILFSEILTLLDFVSH